MDVIKEFLRDLRDWDIVDIQLVSLDEEEKEIERTFERMESYAVHEIRSMM